MATWQYDLELVPRDAADRGESSWGGRAPDGWRDTLGAVLPPGPTWSDHLLAWGEYEGHRIEASTDHGQLVGLRARLDLRQDDLGGVLTRLAAAARALDACFRTARGERIEPDPKALAEVIQASPATRFVENPSAFLRRVALGGYEDA